MKKICLAFLLLLSGHVFSQGVRSLGMGGVVLPGPWASTYNPAYAAYPEDKFGPSNGFAVPLGLINLTINPMISPIYYWTNYNKFIDNFDFVSFIDQLAHPYEFVFNPPKSPDEIIFKYDRSGIHITDGSGNPLRFNYSQKKNSANSLPWPTPFFEISIPTGIDGFDLHFGAYASTKGVGLAASDNLLLAISHGSFQPDSNYSLTASAAAEAGVSGRLSYAGSLPGVLDHSSALYVGIQAEGYYSLYSGSVTARSYMDTDQKGIPKNIFYSLETYLSYPGLGSGYGGSIDLGIVAETLSGTYGLGLRSLIGYQGWSGVHSALNNDGTLTENNVRNNKFIFNPQIFFNGAYSQTLPAGGQAVFGIDASYFKRSFSAHAGIEYQLAIFRLRAGLGYEDGFKLGLGGGIALANFGIDAALTSHQDPLSDQLIYGLAASISWHF